MLHNWYATAVAHARTFDPGVEPVLRAFGPARPSEATPGEFSDLESWARGRVPSMRAEVVDALDEIDRPQAELFARRFESVVAILSTLATPVAAVLRVGLICRVLEILAAPRPRALRVRAACDFYYSQAAVLRHGSDGPPLAQLLADPDWRELEPGLHHAHVRGPSQRGPVNLNLLRLDLDGGRIRTVDCRGEPFADFVARRGALAAVSGGFFLYSEPDIEPPSRRGDPVGLLMDGWLRPPVFRRASLVQRDAGITIERVGLAGVELEVGDHRFEVAAVNDPAAVGEGVVAFNRAWGREVRSANAFAVVGDAVVGLPDATGRVAVPLAGFVVALPTARASTIEVGTRVRCRLARGAPQAAIAGGPMLLGEGALELIAEDFAGTAPPVTFSSDETFDNNLLPRMAVGLTADDRLVFCAVDGRNFDRAPGFTLGMTADCLRALGCVRAMNLDGGSSKRMVVEGAVVDLPSTEVIAGAAEPSRSRPVHTGILLYGRGRQRDHRVDD